MLLLAKKKVGLGGWVYSLTSGPEHSLFRASHGLQEACPEEDVKLLAPRMTPITLAPVHTLQDTFFFLSFVFIGPYLQHMEVPRQGVKLEL